MQGNLVPVPKPSHPFVTIVMPALNEERYIADAIASILQKPEALDYELLVLDGGSRDRTCDIIQDMAADNPRIKVLHNEQRIQSAAMNTASEACDPRTAILVRADCHAHYPADFVVRCVDTLVQMQSSSVVVPMRAVGRSPMQRAIAAAQNSRLGNGGSLHRLSGRSGFVDHGHHAAFDRSVFCALGGYDELAPYNEDAEFDARLIESGGQIYLAGSLTIDYYPRSSLGALAQQYFRHGWGRANTILKHGMLPKLRQVLPVLALLCCAGGLLLWPVVGAIALTPVALYLSACVAGGAFLAIRARDAAVLLAVPALIVMHNSWAAGFLFRLAQRGLPSLFGGPRGLRERRRAASAARAP